MLRSLVRLSAVRASVLVRRVASAAPRRMDGKVALVTGAGTGIGRDIALQFAREGAKIGVAGIVQADNEAVVREIRDIGGEAIALDMDVASESAVENGTKKLIERFGGYHVAVANAGMQTIAPVHEFTLKQWQRMLAVHLDGAFLITRSAYKHMMKNGGGRIIYMGSVHSHEASVLKSAYCAAKHGVLGLSRTVAKEGAEHGISTFTICPGFIKTPLVEKQIPEQAKELGISEAEVVKNVMLSKTVTGEFGFPTDIAELATFVASYPTPIFTGQSLIASHGWHMK